MDSFLSKILIVGGILLVSIIGIVIFGVFMLAGTIPSIVHAQEPAATTIPATQQTPANDPITINKVLDTPVVYKDLQIPFDGQIVGWVTKNAIVVSEVGEKNSGHKLLVISDKKFGLPGDVPASDVALGEKVNVSFTGTVKILRIPNIDDRSLGDEDEMRELMKWNNLPVVFANSVVQK